MTVRDAAAIRADLDHPHVAALLAVGGPGDGPIGRLLRDVEPLLAAVDERGDEWCVRCGDQAVCPDCVGA